MIWCSTWGPNLLLVALGRLTFGEGVLIRDGCCAIGKKLCYHQIQIKYIIAE